MINPRKHFSTGSLIVILITLILFVLALFTKGFTHDLLLEGAVFLVSVKLIQVTYHLNISSEKIIKELSDIKEILNTRDEG